MPGPRTIGDHDACRFREQAFRRLPLAIMAAAAAAALFAGAEWSERRAAVPWIVAIFCVGLPHGAADFAASRRACRGWPLAGVWLAYAVAMVAVAAGFMAAPVPVIAAFAALSCWHFGAAHHDADASRAGAAPRWIAALARGCAVLAMPLAAWPAATAHAAADLAALAVGPARAADLFPAAAVRGAGLVFGGAALLAAMIELTAKPRPRSWRARLRLPLELAVIAGLGWCTVPLFAVGLYFLVWHAWRQMDPLAVSLTGAAPRTWPALGRAVVRIHLAALPLLIPAWTALGAVWWRRSPDHTLQDLAIISIGAYMIVTPAHELLGDLLQTPARILPGPRRSGGGPSRSRGIEGHEVRMRAG